MIGFVINDVPLEDFHITSATVQRYRDIQGKNTYSSYSLSFFYLSLFVVRSLSM